MVEKGKPEVIKCEMVLLAMGFLKPEQPQFADNVFVCGDAATGASLVVRAMAGGRKAAADVDKYFSFISGFFSSTPLCRYFVPMMIEVRGDFMS